MSDFSKRLSQLTPEQRELLARRLAQKAQGRAGGEAPDRIEPRPAAARSVAPLSFAQERLWFLHQLDPESCAFNISQAVRLSGALDMEALRRSLEEIARRHETLRTTFELRDARPVQVVAPEPSARLSFEDLRHLAADERARAAEALLAAEARRPFNLEAGPLVRLLVVRAGEDEHTALLSMHHIVSDGWSMGVLIRELGALYNAFSRGEESPLPELPVQYADFTLWQRARLTGERRERLLDYWRAQLGGNLPVLELPTDAPRGAVQTFDGRVHTFAFPAELSERLRALGRSEGATTFMVLLAAFQILLGRYAGQEDIVVGSNIANRNRRETEGLIGFFINNLVLRTDLSGNPTFRQLLAQVRETTLGAYAHQDLPFETLLEELDLRRQGGSSPLFQVMFVLQNAPASVLRLPGLTLAPVRLDDGQSAFDLTLFVGDTAGGPLNGALEYNTALFNDSTVARMAEQFLHLLGEIAADPGREISGLSMSPEEESRALVFSFNDDLG